MVAVLSVLVGILIVLLIILIATQRKELRELFGLNATLAQQAKDMAEHLDTLKDLEQSNVKLLHILAEESCEEVEDSANEQSTESQPKSKL